MNCEIITWAETKGRLLTDWANPGAPIIFNFVIQENELLRQWEKQILILP